MIIKNQKNVTVKATLNAENKFLFPIFVHFVPQIMKVKSMSFYLENHDETSTVPDQLFILKSALVNYDILTHLTISTLTMFDPTTDLKTYTGTCNQCLNTEFKLNNQIINGNYEFQILTVTDEPPSQLDSLFIQCVITLEFIEYL